MQKSLFSKTLFLIWSTLCIILFIYVPSRVDFIHGFSITTFPLTPQKFERIHLLGLTENLLGSFIGVILFSFVYIAFGSFFTRLILRKSLTEEQPTPHTCLAIIGTAFLLGHLLFSLIFISLGALQKFTSFCIILMLAIGFIIGFPSLKNIFHQSSIIKRLSITDNLSDRDSRKFFYFSVGILFIGLLFSSSRLSYDAAAIYFSDEKLIALTNDIQYFQNDSFVASSFQAGISYAALIKIFGDQAARMYSWINGVVILVFVLAIGEKVGLSKLARLMTILLLLTSTAFLDLTGDGKVDLISTATAVAAVYWTIDRAAQKSTPKSFLIGILVGLAVSSRPFNIFLIGLFISIYYLVKTYNSKGKDLSSILQSIPWIGLGAICMVVSHIFVNWIILGDPLAILKDIQRVNPSNWQGAFDSNALWLFRLFYPITVSIVNLPQSNGNITPLFLALLPGLLLKEIRGKTIVSKALLEALVAAVVTLTLWVAFLFTIFEIRYVLFLWIILFMVLATVIEAFLINNDIYLRKVVEITIITVSMFICVRSLYIWIDTYSPVDKFGNPQCYDSDLCILLEPINQMAIPGDRVLVLGAFRYYLRPDLLICSSKHEEYRILQELSQGDPNEFWHEVHQQGYKYITFNTNFSERHLGIEITPDPANAPDWLELRPIYGKPGERIISYQIYAKNPPDKIKKTCKQNELGIWQVIDIQD